MNFNEIHNAYYDAVTKNGTLHQSIKGAERDAALLPLSCVPVLAVDNHGYSYPVFIDQNGVDPDLLYLVGVPSGWRLAQMLEDVAVFDCGVAIDMGQEWFCTNIQEVLAALLAAGYRA